MSDTAEILGLAVVAAFYPTLLAVATESGAWIALVLGAYFVVRGLIELF